MKRIFLFAALLTAAVAETFACTNLIVGKNASTDVVNYRLRKPDLRGFATFAYCP